MAGIPNFNARLLSGGRVDGRSQGLFPAIDGSGNAQIIADAGYFGTEEPAPPSGFTPTPGALVLAGQGTTLSKGITPATGALALAGQALLLTIGLTPTTGTLSLAGQQPTINVSSGITLTPTTGTLTLAGQQQSIAIGKTPVAGSTTLAGQQPGVAIGRTPVVGGLSLSGQALSIVVGKTPAAGALTLAGQTPSLVQGKTAQAGSLAVAGQAPGLQIGKTPTAGALALVGQAPALTRGFTSATASLSLAGQAPSISKLFTAAVGSLSLTGQSPTLSIQIIFTPTPGALTLAGNAPSISKHFTPSSSVMSLAGQQPSLIKTLSPTSASILLAGQSPKLTTGFTPASASITITGSTPSLSHFMQPAPAVLLIEGAAPSITLYVSAATGTLAITGQLPTITITDLSSLFDCETLHSLPRTTIRRSKMSNLPVLALTKSGIFPEPGSPYTPEPGGGGDLLSQLILPEVDVTGATTLQLGIMHVCSGTDSNYTVTLPAASGNAGKFVGVRMSKDLTKLVTIDAAGSELIDGQASRILWAKESAILMCDGVGWTKVAGKSIPMSGSLGMSAGQLFSNNTDTLIQFGRSLTLDAPAEFQTIATYRMTALREGKYLFAATMLGNGSNSVSHTIYMNIFKNGAQIVPGCVSANAVGASALGSVNSNIPIALAAGDFVQVYLSFNPGSYTTSVFYLESGSYGKYHQFSLTEVISW